MQDEDDLLAEARRATALAIVSSLADEARGYEDEVLRVRVQARAAEALWEADRERARSLFNRAWEEADLVDRAGERRVEEDRRRLFLRQGGGPTFIPPAPNLRLEVLRFAARCDRQLSEKFLVSMEKEKKDETADIASDSSLSNYWDPTEPPTAISKRLEPNWGLSSYTNYAKKTWLPQINGTLPSCRRRPLTLPLMQTPYRYFPRMLLPH
jgi:hypothetical protein